MEKVNLNYVQIARRLLEDRGSITHRDIIFATGGNCSYSTLRALRKKLDLIYQWEVNQDSGKRYKRYFIR